MVTQLVFLLTVFLTALSGMAQTHRYQITWAGANIGVLQATRSQEDSLTVYTLQSQVNFWFFQRIHVRYHLRSVYQGDVLLSSEVTTQSSRGDFRTTVTKEGSRYRVRARAYEYQADTTLHLPIEFNVARLYFQEPHGQTYVLTDAYGLPGELRLAPDGAYALAFRGKRNRFFYRSGKMVRASMYSPLKNYEIRLIPAAL
ncbi:MAG: hypothetical protein MUC38_14530 [Cyclobacteriaceae bacterium]|jgi:hypothetical protein|nr:hypothetical protein [Cyclobacteriaceae bacterium]